MYAYIIQYLILLYFCLRVAVDARKLWTEMDVPNTRVIGPNRSLIRLKDLTGIRKYYEYAKVILTLLIFIGMVIMLLKIFSAMMIDALMSKGIALQTATVLSIGIYEFGYQLTRVLINETQDTTHVSTAAHYFLYWVGGWLMWILSYMIVKIM